MENTQDNQSQQATTQNSDTSAPIFCTKCKLFFGNAQFNNMCSKCFKEEGNFLQAKTIVNQNQTQSLVKQAPIEEIAKPKEEEQKVEIA